MSTGFRANKLRWFWLLLGWMWVAVVFYLSLMPVPPQPVTFWQADKLEHLLAYCLLMLWFSQVYRKFSARLLMAILIVSIGVLIEYLQRETGYRNFDYADMVANGFGVLVGWAWARTGLGRIFAFLEFHSSKKYKRAEH